MPAAGAMNDCKAWLDKMGSMKEKNRVAGTSGVDPASTPESRALVAEAEAFLVRTLRTSIGIVSEGRAGTR